MSLADSQKFCADRVRRLDPDRYLSTLFAPDEHRATLLALYAFNLEIGTIGDMVSESLIGRMRLQWWRDALDKMAAGEDVEHGIGDALAAALERSNISVELPHRMIEGREIDLAERPPVNMGEVETTLDAAVGSLVALASAVLGKPCDPEDDLARYAGLAIGLTGLIRMIPHNARRGRITLPDDLMRRAGAAAAPLLAGHIENFHEEVIEIIAGRARECLGRVRDARPGRSELAAFLPVALAGDYLSRLARANHDPFAPGLEPGRLSRQIRLTRAAWRGRI